MLSDLFETPKKIFIAYLTAGDPSLKATERYAEILADAGVQVLELGVPFSDPMADGPVNQRAAERALENGVSLSDVLDLCARLKNSVPRLRLIVFTYLNPLLRMTYRKFAEKAHDCGVDGLLVVDLPVEEADELIQRCEQSGVTPVFLASPTTSDSRLEKIGAASKAFVYYVSRTGVTGEQTDLPREFKRELARVKRLTRRPVCLGFGISTAEQVQSVVNQTEGVIVGSAFVRCLEESPSLEKAEFNLNQLVRSLIAPLQGESSC